VLGQHFGLAVLALSMIFAVSLLCGLKALKGGEDGRS